VNYETEEEKIQALKDGWKQYGNAIVSGIAVAALVFAGWRYWETQKTTKAVAASQHYEQLLNDFDAGNQDAVLARGQTLIDDYQGTPYSGLGELVLAKQAIEQQEWQQAATYLQHVAEQGPSEFRPVARLRWARLLANQQDYTAALAVLPAEHQGPYAVAYLELRGDLLLAQGDEVAARAAYAKALEKEQQGSPLLQMKYDDLAVADIIGDDAVTTATP